MSQIFGSYLQRLRRTCHDPECGGSLSQERFAELISMHNRRSGFPTPSTVSNWECGRSQPHYHDRETLCALVTVFLKYGGVNTLEEMNTFLAAGGYAALSEAELTLLEMQVGQGVRSANDGESVAQSSSREGCAKEPEQAEAILILVRHQAVEPISQKAVLTSLPAVYAHYQLIDFEIEQCDLVCGNRLIDPRAAAQRQAESAQHIAALQQRYPLAEIVYCGSAHIPMHFLAGFQLAHRGPITVLEFDRYQRTWDQLQRHEDVSNLSVSGVPQRIQRSAGPVVVRVSIAHLVTTDVVAEVIPSPGASIHIFVKRPKVDVITNEHQIREYGRIFRQTMDIIHERMPNASGIHIFFAGPAALAFYCGQLISKTIHPRVVVYNFTGHDVPRYSWGIDLTRAVTAPDFLVEPVAVSGDGRCSP